VFSRCHRCDGVFRFLSEPGNDRDYDSTGRVTHASERTCQDDRWRGIQVIGWSRHRHRKTFSKLLNVSAIKTRPGRCERLGLALKGELTTDFFRKFSDSFALDAADGQVFRSGRELTFRPRGGRCIVRRATGSFRMEYPFARIRHAHDEHPEMVQSQMRAEAPNYN
jgi:hypothetical protein